MPPDAAQALNELVKVLTPLAPEDRRRAIKGAMAFLGEEWNSTPSVAQQVADAPKADGAGDWPHGLAWMKQNGISADQLEHVFAFNGEGKLQIIADIPGKGKRPQAINVYLLVGLATHLRTGERFEDELARGECVRHSCYDQNNHHNTLKDNMKSELIGTKSEGWSLTKPGINKATEVLKEILGAAK
jgi:hypothetical protein